MTMLLAILAIVTGLAYMSQRVTIQYADSGKTRNWDIYLIILLIFLILFAGLRTRYNDTQNYIFGFQNSTTIRPFLADTSNLSLLENPLFYGFQALVKTFTNNVNVFFIICAIIVNTLNVQFIKRNVDPENFAFSMFLYTTIGTLMLSIAAQKQILAMSVLTLALSALFEKKYIRYYIIVFLAGLIHTYAWTFFFLPLLATKPWSFRTFILLIITIVVMYTFQSTISSFLEVADQVGKDIPLEEVFDGNQINILRVSVYAVVPLIALFFKGLINDNINRRNGIFIQMSIISLVFMLMGTQNGANMFGRCANYFEIGSICALPWVIKQLFTRESILIVLTCAIICFGGFYISDNNNFNIEYQSKSFFQFISEII
ncbi:hypothetical protein B5E92_14660 [Erysipelatoclostridium sp. An15]|uniref:EpsG family protein n=1 Tax=Erysipelatoclostridium sp. An15 TaxID=1965566 RepID=UPI000B36E863|nr:EpsG family protein [Erysipelatoclostridium sp. An15]OUQ02416.1 hypothetical protein B5E92_14660 [Erysipelatoclostridium sp. An15]